MASVFEVGKDAFECGIWLLSLPVKAETPRVITDKCTIQIAYGQSSNSFRVDHQSWRKKKEL
jgi:hypothetical protein